jgi:hypothetical protein
MESEAANTAGTERPAKVKADHVTDAERPSRAGSTLLYRNPPATTLMTPENYRSKFPRERSQGFLIISNNLTRPLKKWHWRSSRTLKTVNSMMCPSNHGPL